MIEGYTCYGEKKNKAGKGNSECDEDKFTF